jgi:hypothetical protein
LAQTDFVRAIELLCGFILRRLACGEQSRQYGYWFVAACLELGDQPLEGLRSFLIGKGFPVDGRFKQYFINYDLYRSGYRRAILEALERTVGGKELTPNLSEADIEHVMPQTLTAEWRNALGPEADRIYSQWINTVGNLTLTSANQKVGNKPYAVKREVFKNSYIPLTRELALHYDTWTEAEIIDRGARLADLAATIWKGPDA